MITYNDSETSYVTIDPLARAPDDQSIGINSLFAKVLGLEENSLVMVSEIVKLATIKSCTVSALNNTDHYILVNATFP